MPTHVEPDQAHLAAIEALTLQHYQQHAAAFWEGTKDHDVTQNYAAFLDALPKQQELAILDLGCGPGRDVAYFKALGHKPMGLDGCEAFCQMARAYTGCEILHQQFTQLVLPGQAFDGVFANASLFHVPALEFPRVLSVLRQALKPQGVLFMSNPRGQGEGWSGSRYGHYLEIETMQPLLLQAGFTVLDYYYRPPGKPRHEQPWLAITAQVAA